MSTVIRYDRASAPVWKRDARGALRAKGALTREGVFEYRLPSGEVVREFRPLSEIASPQALADIEALPLTDGHPAEFVGPENIRDLGRGVALPGARVDGDLVVADLVIQDADLIAAVEAGERFELSLGYRCEIIEEPGVYQGQRFDRRQVGHRWNHCAVLPKGAGRGGPQVSLRADSAIQVVDDGETALRAEIKSLRTRLQVVEDRNDAEFQRLLEKGRRDWAEASPAMMDRLAERAAERDRWDVQVARTRKLTAEIAARNDEAEAEDPHQARRNAFFAFRGEEPAQRVDSADPHSVKRNAYQHPRRAEVRADGEADPLAHRRSAYQRARPELFKRPPAPEAETKADGEDVDPYAVKRSAYQRFREGR